MELIRRNLFKDLDLDFAPHPVTLDVPQKIDAEAVKRSVRNLVLMTKNDKPFHPEIDSRIYKMLFEPASPLVALAIRSNIMDVLNRYEPRASINDVIVTFDDVYNSFDVTVSFMVKNTREISKVSLSIERLR